MVAVWTRARSYLSGYTHTLTYSLTLSMPTPSLTYSLTNSLTHLLTFSPSFVAVIQAGQGPGPTYPDVLTHCVVALVNDNVEQVRSCPLILPLIHPRTCSSICCLPHLTYTLLYNTVWWHWSMTMSNRCGHALLQTLSFTLVHTLSCTLSPFTHLLISLCGGIG